MNDNILTIIPHNMFVDEILCRLPVYNLYLFCSTNRYYYELLSDEHVWGLLLKRNFSDLMLIYHIPCLLSNKCSYYEFNKLRSYYVPLIEEHIKTIDSFDPLKFTHRLETQEEFLIVFDKNCDWAIQLLREYWIDHEVPHKITVAFFNESEAFAGQNTASTDAVFMSSPDFSETTRTFSLYVDYTRLGIRSGMSNNVNRQLIYSLLSLRYMRNKYAPIKRCKY